VGPPWVTIPQGCPSFQERASSPVFSAVYPSSSLLKLLPTCFLTCPPLAVVPPKRAHTQRLLCLQGKHLAGRQVKYDPKPLGASADLAFEFSELWIVPLWNEYLAEGCVE